MGWQMKSIDALGRKTECNQIWRVEYVGGGLAHVEVCETVTSATGLELQQNWKARANTVTFFNNKYFVTVNWDEGTQDAVTALTRQLEKKLTAN